MAHVELRPKPVVVECGAIRITSNGVGHGELTVDGVELKHSELTFEANVGEMDQLIIRTTPRNLAAFAAGIRAAAVKGEAAT